VDERVVRVVVQEIAAPEEVPVDLPAEHDGFGVWTAEELAHVDGADPVASDAEVGGDDTVEETSDEDGTEPVNRGLLLKFLSSVRS
jgi:hypothetical protein